MARTINPNIQYEKDGKPLVGGKVYYGVANQDPIANPITIFSDSQRTVPITNPQILTDQGRLSTPVYVGVNQYSFQVDDALDNQQLADPQLEPLNIVGLVTANIDLNGFKVVNAADGTANSDYATFGQNNELYGQGVIADAASTADAIVANLPVSPDALLNGQQISVLLTHGANTITTPTFKLNAFAAKTISREDDNALAIGDTGGVDNYIDLIFNLNTDKWQILNPKTVSFPAGGFINLWSGTLANIPAQWSICDGTNGTPDLRDRFILSVGAAEDPGGTGGSTNGSTTATTSVSAGTPSGTNSGTSLSIAQLPSHDHILPLTLAGGASVGPALNAASGGTGAASFETTATTGSGATHTHTFSGSALSTHSHNSTNNFPLFFKLAYIMFTG